MKVTDVRVVKEELDYSEKGDNKSIVSVKGTVTIEIDCERCEFYGAFHIQEEGVRKQHLTDGLLNSILHSLNTNR